MEALATFRIAFEPYRAKLCHARRQEESQGQDCFSVIHVAHVIIDGIIGDAEDQSLAEDANHEPEMHPDAIANVYWQLVRQERSAWTLELDLRPNREKFFE